MVFVLPPERRGRTTATPARPPIRLRIRLEHPAGGYLKGTGYHREIGTELPFRSNGDVDMAAFLRRVVQGIYLENAEGHFVPHTRTAFLRACLECLGAPAWPNEGGLRLRLHGMDILDVGPEVRRRTTVSFRLVRTDGEPVCMSGDAYRCLEAMSRDESDGDGGVSLVLVPRITVGGRRETAEVPTNEPPLKRARTVGEERGGKKSGRGRQGGKSERRSPKRGPVLKGHGGPKDGASPKEDDSETEDETLTRKSVAAISVESKDCRAVTKVAMEISEIERASTADEDLNSATNGYDWCCRHCTLINPGTLSICNACNLRRESTRGRNGGRSAPQAIDVGIERSGDDVKSLEMSVTSTKRMMKPRKKKKKEKKKKKKKKRSARDRVDDAYQSPERRGLGLADRGGAKSDEGSIKDDVSDANNRAPKKSVTTEPNFIVAKDCDAPNEVGERKLAPSDEPISVHLSECRYHGHRRTSLGIVLFLQSQLTTNPGYAVLSVLD